MSRNKYANAAEAATRRRQERLAAHFEAIDKEIERSWMHGAVFSSLHEAYGVILEEVDELWDIAKMKRKHRSRIAIREELVQIAAMAVKALDSMDNFVEGDV